jgi:two-component system, OmpR family, phosphate regulon response regulator OmpR
MTRSAPKGHLLVVDDDDRIRTLLQRFLEGKGHHVTAARDAAQARRMLQTMAFDLIVLDVMMPGESGLDLLRAVREEIKTPAILLTALGETHSRIEGLKAGADDYLPKPFEPEELALRIEAILRRSAQPDASEDLRLSDLVFSVAKAELRRDGRLVRLTEAETALLRVLAAKPGEPVARHELLHLVSNGLDRSIDVQVTRLRRKIEPDPKNPVHLQTVRGIGYRLVTD